jgi:Tfp pilus assembly protein PilX
MEVLEKRKGGRVTAASRGFFLMVGVSAIVVVVFLIVASAF